MTIQQGHLGLPLTDRCSHLSVTLGWGEFVRLQEQVHNLCDSKCVVPHWAESPPPKRHRLRCWERHEVALSIDSWSLLITFTMEWDILKVGLLCLPASETISVGRERWEEKWRHWAKGGGYSCRIWAAQDCTEGEILYNKELEPPSNTWDPIWFVHSTHRNFKSCEKNILIVNVWCHLFFKQEKWPFCLWTLLLGEKN